jgi:hypothetical protein
LNRKRKNNIFDQEKISLPIDKMPAINSEQ